MSIDLHFLGWDEPVTEKVGAFLLPADMEGPADLSGDLVIVPTRQAGRRLRESLARRCAARDTALFSPQVATPTFFLHGRVDVRVANGVQMAAVWAECLMKCDLGDYPGLFPAAPPDQDFAWALGTGEMIQRLRATLTDGGLHIGGVLREAGGSLAEPERWKDLARLEGAFLTRLLKLGLEDPCRRMVEEARAPTLAADVQRVVVAAVPDPTLLMVQALGVLAEQVPVHVLVHAPDELSGRFDTWGRPLSQKWAEVRIDIPDPDRNVFLAGTPVSQSRVVLSEMNAEAGRFGPADVAIGVPDRDVVSSLAAQFEEEGLPVFDPAGKCVAEHPLCHLLDASRAIVNRGTYQAVSHFIRHPDVLAYLQDARGVRPGDVLEQLDGFQNDFLPMGWGDIEWRFRSDEDDAPKGALAEAVTLIRKWVESALGENLDASVRGLLQRIYEHRTLRPGNPVDDDFRQVAQCITATLEEFAAPGLEKVRTNKQEVLDLFVHRLAEQRYYPERFDAVIDLEGWLELPWNDAPFLIVTGMNDGCVPDGRLSDVFLPDSLRMRLGLRGDADRLARDVYLMSGLLASRSATGRVCFIAGKTSAAGEPLKPSRLLFRCPDDELPARAQRLFGEPADNRENCPATISFKLNPVPAADAPSNGEAIASMHVTMFRDYLACPFRFYLRRVLGMEPLDDQKSELDAMDFGDLIHRALQAMGEDEALRRCEDEDRLRDVLWSDLASRVTRRFGRNIPLQVEIQLDAARQRLSAAARAQAALAAEGWETVATELKLKAVISGTPVSGKIDRIDRNRKSGALRILDYKTSDRTKPPEKIHWGTLREGTPVYARIQVGKKERKWMDLQLPLYRLLLSSHEDFAGPAELGYFNLPKAATDTGVVLWEGFDEDLLAAAQTCAEGVVAGIQQRTFWPPAQRVQYDEFETLFHAEIDKCIDVEAFKEAMTDSGKGVRV